jgi:hypothetical protein
MIKKNCIGSRHVNVPPDNISIWIAPRRIILFYSLFIYVLSPVARGKLQIQHEYKQQ